ncbi:MAG: chaperone NapD [Betaproteobacteria bacterium]
MSATRDDEVHVAGLVVHAHPEALSRVERAIRAIDGAEIPASARDGKLVVTLETRDGAAIADALVCIQTLDGVLAAALVYQHSEPESAMNEEVDLEDHAPGVR